jgi:hypothetical protein
MAPRTFSAALAISGVIASSLCSAADGLCKPLTDFITSVRPNETRVLKFHTSWGSNFHDSNEPALAAKRCDHGGYEPAKAVCDYLMEHGATEFSGNNAKSAIGCLSTKTRFAAGTELHSINFSLTFGGDDRGSLVDITLQEDKELGGMVLSITADGY